MVKYILRFLTTSNLLPEEALILKKKILEMSRRDVVIKYR